MAKSQTALRYEVEVAKQGRIELKVPFPAGTRATIFVIENSENSFIDLTAAAQGSLDFWDNPFDDEDWNNA